MSSALAGGDTAAAAAPAAVALLEEWCLLGFAPAGLDDARNAGILQVRGWRPQCRDPAGEPTPFLSDAVEVEE